ncbi:MAG: hypothetical protein DRJ68_05430 [Thermoprotei archaeon]|nr:MAG: hypothetical protein DRJ68_05430 [Thermoprotei archaeon]
MSWHPQGRGCEDHNGEKTRALVTVNPAQVYRQLQAAEAMLQTTILEVRRAHKALLRALGASENRQLSSIVGVPLSSSLTVTSLMGGRTLPIHEL